MKTTITLNAIASSVTLALTLGLASAAHAGDFEDNYPAFAEAQAQQQAAGQRVVISAPRPARNSADSVSTEESRAMLGEDSGAFWMAQQQAKPAATTLARAATLQR
jgi:hypothetical protein